MNVVFVLALFVAVTAAAPGRDGYRRRSFRPSHYDRGYGYDRYHDDGYEEEEYADREPYRRPPPLFKVKPCPEDNKQSAESTEVERVYRFHIAEEDYGAYLYHDKSGKADGFVIDLMHTVCEHAGKECYFLLDKNTNCWYFEEGHEYPGIGLMAGWYDGCLGMLPTTERKNSFEFSDAFTQNMKVAMYYKKNTNRTEHDNKMHNHTVGFVKGWPTSQTCLSHQAAYLGNQIGEYEAVMFEDYKHMVDAVMHDEVDIVLAPKALDLDEMGLGHIEPYFYCSPQGASLMVRYGDELLNWWNKAFDEMKESGEYEQLCQSAQRKHGDHGKIHCL